MSDGAHSPPSPPDHGADPVGREGRGRRLLGVLLPGLPSILRGRVAAGSAALLLWIALIATAVVGRARFVGALSGTWDERLALATWALAILLLAAWSRREGRPESARRARPARTQWALAWDAFRKNRLAVAAAAVVVLAYLLALLTPLLAPSDPALQGELTTERLLPPSSLHPLGTDQFARDVLSRVLYGARISMTIGFVAMSISMTIGTLLGAVSGFAGGRVDTVIMRVVDMVLSFPRLVLLIAIIAFFEPSIFLIVAVLGLTQWPHPTRLVRGEVLSIREREFIQAGRALGLSGARMVLRHVVPNALAPVIVAATLGIGDTIVLEAGLSFLGLGVQPPTPSWGTMVADGRDNLFGAWWISTFPGLAIVLVVLSFNIAGDGLRDALDPRSRR